MLAGKQILGADREAAARGRTGELVEDGERTGELVEGCEDVQAHAKRTPSAPQAHGQEEERMSATAAKPPQAAKRDGPELREGSDEAVRLRIVLTRLARRLRQTASAGPLSATEVEVLATVARKGPVRPTDLAALAGLNPTMLSRIVAKLEELGLLARTVDAADRRVSLVGVTGAGRALHDRIRTERTDLLSTELSSMPPSARRSLYEALPALELLAERLLERDNPVDVRGDRRTPRHRG